MKALLKKHLALIIIVALAAAMRLYALGIVPPSLSWDEAAIGWNAKNIFHTRRDEYGTHLPLVFKSFGDYKAPLYIYLTAPIVGFFGLTPVNIRLLAALSGVAAVVFIYLLAEKLVGKKAAGLAGLLAALSPWGLLMSRGAFEASLSLALILAGVYFYLRGDKQIWWRYLSVICLALSMYAYHSAKLFVPVFVLGLIYLYRPRQVWGLMLATVILIAPLIHSTVFGGAANRFQGASIFYSTTGERQPLNFTLAENLATNYAKHYSPQFLFAGGGVNFRQQLKDYGLLLIVQAPLLLLGLVYLFKQRGKTEAKLLWWWLMVSPVAAMVGRAVPEEVPHAIRALNLLPALILISAGGVSWVNLKKPLLYGLIGLNFALVFYHYLMVYPIYAAKDWQYGYQQVAQRAAAYEDTVDKIMITDYYGQPYIFTLVYQQRRPLNVFWGAMSKYLYSPVNWDSVQHYSNQLIIGSPAEIPADAAGLVETINFPDGTPAFRLVKTPVQP